MNTRRVIKIEENEQNFIFYKNFCIIIYQYIIQGDKT